MSQAGIISTTSGPSPPDVPTTFEADEGSAVPVANTLIVSADDTTDNNTNGIQTRAGVAEGLAANEVQVQLTNRIQGTVTSNDDSGDVLISFPLDTSDNHNYTFDFTISAVSILPGPITVGGSWKLFSGAITDGTAISATLLGVDTSVNFKSGTDVGGQTMIDTDVDALIVGSAFVITVTGMSATDVFWNAVGYYTQIGD